MESGAPYCMEAMNAVDYAVEESDAKSVMSIGFEGDYGGDSAGGVEAAAEANGMDFENLETVPARPSRKARSARS